MVELADTPDLGSGVERHGGSSPFARTIKTPKTALLIVNYEVTWLMKRKIVKIIAIVTLMAFLLTSLVMVAASFLTWR